MTRSGISELADYVKGREGLYGLRRVERAADEIPRLGELYTPEALRSAFSGDNARTLMTINPSEFESYATPLLSNLSQESKQNIANLKAIQNAGGFSDVPFFVVNKELAGSTGLPWISGHEGRHRNRAMAASGEQAGLVQFLPRAELREPFPRRSQEQYIDAIKKEMELSGNKVKPEAYYVRETDKETFQRPAIDLPDLYADGGMVDSAPEEAIKNTIQDPQAYRMLDMDLANLALMNQPQRMAGGGGAKKDDVFDLKPQPKNVDTKFARLGDLLADIGKNRAQYEKIAAGAQIDSRKLTPENIYAIRLLQAANKTQNPERYLESLSPYHNSQLQYSLDPYIKDVGAVYKDEPNKAVIHSLRGVENTIPHEMTHTLQLGKGFNPDIEANTQAFDRAQALPTDMRRSVFPSTNVDNMKELWANINARAHEVNAAGGDFINSPEGKAMFPTPREQRDYYASAMPGVNSWTPDTGTFVPNNQSVLDQIRSKLGFAKGGAVYPSVEEMRIEMMERHRAKA